MAILRDRTLENLERVSLEFFGPTGNLFAVTSFDDSLYPLRYGSSYPHRFWFKNAKTLRVNATVAYSLGVGVGEEGFRTNYSGSGTGQAEILYGPLLQTGKPIRRNFSLGQLNNKELEANVTVTGITKRERAWDSEGNLILDETTDTEQTQALFFADTDSSVQFRNDSGTIIFAPRFVFNFGAISTNPEIFISSDQAAATVEVELMGDPVTLYAEEDDDFTGSATFAIEIEETF